MTRPHWLSLVIASLLAVLVAVPDQAAINVRSNPPGGDGALDLPNVTTPCKGGVLVGNVCTIELHKAVATTWNTAGTGVGVYDADKWAVVFKYDSVNIGPTVTVRFENHPSRAPVVWLVDTTVTIDGTVDLIGGDGLALVATPTEPGPGGFRGGSAEVSGGSPSSAGFGPGGGNRTGEREGGSYRTLGHTSISAGSTYGNDRVLPLIGGSGGTPWPSGNWAAAAGGGAILIAADETITVNGSVLANGGGSTFNGSAAGSGGAIRLLADRVQGTGMLRAVGGNALGLLGGSGRIRLEAVQSIALANVNPTATTGDPCVTLVPDCTAVLWPEDEDAAIDVPAVEITQIKDQVIPPDPHARLEFPDQDVSFADDMPVTVAILATDVPATGWDVKVRATPATGSEIIVCACEVGRSDPTSNWEADVTFPNGFAAVQVHASVGTDCPNPCP